MTRYELKRTSDNQFLWNLKAANNEVILTSERYKAKPSAEAGIESVRINSALDDKYERRTSTDNKPYFVLKAANGEIIGRSELYESMAGMENGIRSVKTNGPIAKVVDNSAEAPPPKRPQPQAQPIQQAASAVGEPAPRPTPLPVNPPVPPPSAPPSPQQPRPML